MIVCPALADDRGTCPDEAAPPASIPKAAKDEAKTDTVFVQAVISDTGYVCSARSIMGPNKNLKRKAEDAIRAWKLQPAMRGGRPVPVTVTITVQFRKDAEGKLSPQIQQPSAGKN